MKLNEKLKSSNCFINRFLNENEKMKWNTLFWGLTAIITPFIIIFLYKFSIKMDIGKVMNDNTIDVVTTILVLLILFGIYSLFLSAIGFANKKGFYGLINILAFLYAGILWFLILLNIDLYNNLAIVIIFVFSFMIIIFNIFNMIFKILKAIYEKFIGMEESKQISLILPIITGIFGYLIKK